MDLLIDETTFAPSFSAFVFASALDRDDSVPVKIIFLPVIFDLTVSIFLINKKMLNKKEIEWIDKYHSDVKSNLLRFMNEQEKKWLINQTSPLIN